MDVEIIDRVLSRRASTEEARQVARWFATDEGQAYLARRYDREAYFMTEQTIDEWLRDEIPAGRMKQRFISLLKERIRSYRFKIAAAALIPLLLLVGSFIFVAQRTGVFADYTYTSVHVPYGEQLHLLLQDGTRVQLNSGSELVYPKSFGLFSRKVRLIGEAYFSVAKETARPFIVMTHEQVDVKVTGTKFNLKAYPDDRQIGVILEEGSVAIIDKDKNVYPLTANQYAVFDKNTGACSVQTIDELTQHTAWRSKSLNFYRTPLNEILKILERQYDVTFTVNDSSVLSHKFSISTNKVRVEDTLLDLEKVSKLRFVFMGEGHYEVK